MERGVLRGKREVCPSDQATRRAWGIFLIPQLVQGSPEGIPLRQAWQTTICQACMAVQAQLGKISPQGGVRWINKIHLTYLVWKVTKQHKESDMSRSKDMPLSCFTHFLEYTAFGVPVQYQLLFLLSSFSPDYPVIFSHFFAQFRPCIQWIAGTLAFWCGFVTYKRDFTNCLIKKHIS